MKRRCLPIVIATLILPAQGIFAQTGDDMRAVKQIEEAWERAWNRHDADALALLMTEDTDFVTILGNRYKGRDAWRAAIARVLATQASDSVWTTEEVLVQLLKPDVALVHVRWRVAGSKDPQGAPQDPSRGWFTRVIVKESGNWLIRATHAVGVRTELAR